MRRLARQSVGLLRRRLSRVKAFLKGSPSEESAQKNSPAVSHYGAMAAEESLGGDLTAQKLYLTLQAID